MPDNYDVLVKRNVLKLFKNESLKLERDLNSVQSYVWKEYAEHIAIIIAQDKEIRNYKIQKSNFDIYDDLILRLEYEFKMIHFIWSNLVLMTYDESLSILQCYNCAVCEEIGFIRIDPENNELQFLDDESFQLVAVSWDKNSQTSSRYLNHYFFDSNQKLALRKSTLLPVGFGDYHIVRAENCPIYALVLTTISQKRSLVLFFLDDAHIAFNEKAFSYKMSSTSTQVEWIDLKDECLYIERDSELLAVPFFGEVSHRSVRYKYP